MVEIVISHEPFAFSKEIVKEYGTFSLLPEYQLRTFTADFSFSIEDITFVQLYSKEGSLTGLAFREQIIADGYVPLDAYCAKALSHVFAEDWFSFRKFLARLIKSSYLFQGSSGVQKAKDCGMVRNLLLFAYRLNGRVEIPRVGKSPNWSRKSHTRQNPANYAPNGG